MNSVETTLDWTTANQRCLAAELAVLKSLIYPAVAELREGVEESEASRDFQKARADLPAPPALDWLCQAFGLSPFERALLILAAAPELDSSFSTSIANSSHSTGNPLPTFSLALAMLPEAHWDALANSAPLRYWKLIDLGGSASLTQSSLKINERILFYITGVDVLDERLASRLVLLQTAQPLTESESRTLDRLAETWRNAAQNGAPSPILQLCGSDPDPKRSLAEHLGQISEQRVFCLVAAHLPTAVDDLESLHRLWERESILQNAILLLECDRDDEPDPARELAIDRWIELSKTRLVLSTREPRSRIQRPLVTFDVVRPTRAEQRATWLDVLGNQAVGLNGQLDRVISQFDFTTQSIRLAASRVGQLEADQQNLSAVLWDSCRRHARPKLEDLAQRISTKATWDDLILPPLQMEMLRAIAAQIRHRAKVCDDWGFGEKSSRGLGLSALFSGPSGTGKTLAAEILANEMQLDLFRIDLSSVVSKYIGETEKNLRRVFDAAEEGGAVLLFDEADALFGKRSEVKESHDRYANVEVSYLLQRMEAYRGLAILTTNLKDALDPAFLRRIAFVVSFPFPDQSHRAEIWRRIFPSKTPTQGLDATLLSRLSVAGGNIRSIALNAAYAAADADEPVTMRHLLRATRSEYAKLEKPLTEAEIGGWK